MPLPELNNELYGYERIAEFLFSDSSPRSFSYYSPSIIHTIFYRNIHFCYFYK